MDGYAFIHAFGLTVDLVIALGLAWFCGLIVGTRARRHVERCRRLH